MTRAGPSAVAILVLAALALAPPRPASADEALVDLLRAGGQVIVMHPGEPLRGGPRPGAPCGRRLVVLTPLGRGGFRVAGTMRP